MIFYQNMKSNRDYSDRDAPTDSHSDSKRNVKSKGREYKTPHYTDADIEQRIPELENGCYFEYKSGESLSSESGAASPLGSNGRNGRGGGGRGDIITSRSAAAMTNNHGSNHAPTHHQTAYATTAINSTIAITTEDNTNMIAANTVKNIRRRYNTTSTVHAANTITSPHCEQILFW